MLTHAVVTLNLDNCTMLCVRLSLKTTEKLIQSIAACHFTATNYFCHLTPILEGFHRLLIRFWAQLKVLALTFKNLHSLEPSCLKNHLYLYQLYTNFVLYYSFFFYYSFFLSLVSGRVWSLWYSETNYVFCWVCILHSSKDRKWLHPDPFQLGK